MILLPDDKPLFGAQLAENEYSKGLVGFWPFRRAGNLVDFSHFGNHGTITGAEWRGQGLFFDGDDFVEIAPDTSLEPSLLTIIARIKIPITAVFQRVITKGSAGFGYFIQARGNNGRLEMGSGGDGTLAEDNVLTAETWHTVAGVWDGVAYNLYVDGQLCTGATLTGSYGLNVRAGESLQLSRLFSGGFFFSDDASTQYVAIYSRALSASEIQALYIDQWLPLQRDRIIFAPTAVTGAVRLINGGLIDSGLVGGRLIA